MASYAATAGNRVVQQEHHDRADDGHEHAPQVESRYTCSAYKREQKPPGNRADDPEDNVQDDASTLLVHDLAGDKTGDQTQDDPADNGHLVPPSSMFLPYVQAILRLGCVGIIARVEEEQKAREHAIWRTRQPPFRGWPGGHLSVLG